MSGLAHGATDEWDDVIQALDHPFVEEAGANVHPLSIEDEANDQEWEQTLHELDDYHADLNVQNTQQVLTHLFERLDLTPRERQGLDPTLGQLRTMLARLEQSVIQIAVFGLVGRGKSSLLNALIGQDVFATGPLHGVTTAVSASPWTVTQETPSSPSASSSPLTKNTDKDSPSIVRLSIPVLSTAPPSTPPPSTPPPSTPPQSAGRAENPQCSAEKVNRQLSTSTAHPPQSPLYKGGSSGSPPLQEGARGGDVVFPQDCTQEASSIPSGPRIELVDTPGIDEVDGDARSRLAHQVAKQADLILFVVAGDMTTVEHEALKELRQFSKPMLLVFNKVDQYPNSDRHQLYQTLQDQRVKALLSPDEIVMASAAPLVSEVVHHPGGRTSIKRRRGEPNVVDLKLKILDVLQREGKALVALNTMLYADEVHDQLVQRKTEIRDRAANDLIWQIVMAKAIATALNPITVVDILSGVVVDVVMLVALSRLYGLPMTHHGAVKLLRHIAVGMGGISITELFTTLGLSSLKGMLGIAVPVTGGLSLAPYVSVAIAQAGVAGVATYAIGQICKQYLANGASWGKDGPKTAIKTILNSLDEASILHRVKSELEERLAQSGSGPSSEPSSPS